MDSRESVDNDTGRPPSPTFPSSAHSGEAVGNSGVRCETMLQSSDGQQVLLRNSRPSGDPSNTQFDPAFAVPIGPTGDPRTNLPVVLALEGNIITGIIAPPPLGRNNPTVIPIPSAFQTSSRNNSQKKMKANSRSRPTPPHIPSTPHRACRMGAAMKIEKYQPTMDSVDPTDTDAVLRNVQRWESRELHRYHQNDSVEFSRWGRQFSGKVTRIEESEDGSARYFANFKNDGNKVSKGYSRRKVCPQLEEPGALLEVPRFHPHYRMLIEASNFNKGDRLTLLDGSVYVCCENLPKCRRFTGCLESGEGLPPILIPYFKVVVWEKLTLRKGYVYDAETKTKKLKYERHYAERLRVQEDATATEGHLATPRVRTPAKRTASTQDSTQTAKRRRQTAGTGRGSWTIPAARRRGQPAEVNYNGYVTLTKEELESLLDESARRVFPGIRSEIARFLGVADARRSGGAASDAGTSSIDRGRRNLNKVRRELQVTMPPLSSQQSPGGQSVHLRHNSDVDWMRAPFDYLNTNTPSKPIPCRSPLASMGPVNDGDVLHPEEAPIGDGRTQSEDPGPSDLVGAEYIDNLFHRLNNSGGTVDLTKTPKRKSSSQLVEPPSSDQSFMDWFENDDNHRRVSIGSDSSEGTASPSVLACKPRTPPLRYFNDDGGSSVVGERARVRLELDHLAPPDRQETEAPPDSSEGAGGTGALQGDKQLNVDGDSDSDDDSSVDGERARVRLESDHLTPSNRQETEAPPDSSEGAGGTGALQTAKQLNVDDDSDSGDGSSVDGARAVTQETDGSTSPNRQETEASTDSSEGADGTDRALALRTEKQLNVDDDSDSGDSSSVDGARAVTQETDGSTSPNRQETEPSTGSSEGAVTPRRSCLRTPGTPKRQGPPFAHTHFDTFPVMQRTYSITSPPSTVSSPRGASTERRLSADGFLKPTSPDKTLSTRAIALQQGRMFGRPPSTPVRHAQQPPPSPVRQKSFYRPPSLLPPPSPARQKSGYCPPSLLPPPSPKRQKSEYHPPARQHSRPVLSGASPFAPRSPARRSITSSPLPPTTAAPSTLPATPITTTTSTPPAASSTAETTWTPPADADDSSTGDSPNSPMLQTVPLHRLYKNGKGQASALDWGVVDELRGMFPAAVTDTSGFTIVRTSQKCGIIRFKGGFQSAAGLRAGNMAATCEPDPFSKLKLFCFAFLDEVLKAPNYQQLILAETPSSERLPDATAVVDLVAKVPEPMKTIYVCANNALGLSALNFKDVDIWIRAISLRVSSTHRKRLQRANSKEQQMK